ncbi:MAG TPA: VOC family protein [Acidimicrobiales bacterium]
MAARDVPGVRHRRRARCPGWFELFTRDFAGALEFYRSVFHWKTEIEGDTDEFRYATLRDADTDDQRAGVMDASAFLPEGVPAHWSVYWQVDDVDATADRVKVLGGAVVDGPTDTPYGRMATVTDPSGAMFKLRTPPS